MFQRIKSYILILSASLMVLISCSSDDNKIVKFSTQVDASGTSFDVSTDATNPTKNAKYSMVTLFSTDGKKFVNFPQVAVGQTYQIKVVSRVISGADTTDTDITADGAFMDFDWSASNPKPNGETTAKIQEFTMKSSNEIIAKLTNHLCTLDLSTWAGAWAGKEDCKGCSTDNNNITQDSSNPNKFIMDNFFGDGVDAYFILSPGAKYFDQIVTMPEQTTSEGGVASGTGLYDQCTGVFNISVTYVLDGDTYTWGYFFTKK